MATVLRLSADEAFRPARSAAGIGTADDDDSVGTLTLIARQFADVAGADGTALMLQNADEPGSSVLSLDGACVGIGGPDMGAAAADSETWTEADSPAGHWFLRRFPVSRDGRTWITLAALFGRATGSARAVAEADRRFQPLIAGIARLWGRNRSARLRLSGYASALNHADVGVVLLDSDADILFANGAASRLLDGGIGVRRRRRSLTSSDLSEAVKLQIAIDHVIDGRTSALAPQTPVVALGRGAGQRPLIVSVLPPEEPVAGPRSVAAILYLCDPDQDLKPLMQGACRYYRLSPVETRLAVELAAGLSLVESATRLRIKEQTARSYLKQIFIKTGTCRQGELIRVLLTSMSRTSSRAALDLI